jgi:hypothetical protein
VNVAFDGGEVSSDGGSLLLRQADRYLGLTEAIARQIRDPRRRKSVEHTIRDLLRQRVYGIALGHEDLNDHDQLRDDPAFQTSVERDRRLAGHSVLQRFEQHIQREDAWAMHRVLVDAFVQSFSQAPEELVLDFDATDDLVHGQQEGRFFHGYYNAYCFLPLYVFCGSQLLVAYLRPSNMDAARHAWAILKLLVRRLRKAWPKVKIIFRGDGSFCRWKMLRWCDRNDVGYIVGLAKNPVLLERIELLRMKAELQYLQTGRKARQFTSIRYAAHTWDRPRRVIAKAEHTAAGSNVRFVVTNLKGRAQPLYDQVYCGRGDMENRIKEQQLYLFADRTSAHKWWANQFRLLLSSIAYVLVETLRRVGLRATELHHARVDTIRLKLLKIGALVTRTTRRIRLRLPTACPHQDLFWLVAHRLARE